MTSADTMEVEDDNMSSHIADDQECVKRLYSLNQSVNEESPAISANDASAVLTSTWLAVLSSIAYTLGSFGFVWSSWVDDWLFPFEIACGVWTVGCLLVLAAIAAVPCLAHARRGTKDIADDNPSLEEGHRCKESDELGFDSWLLWPVPQICQALCATLFCVGCGFGFGSERRVTQQLPIISSLFLAGSCFLVLDVLWNALLLLIVTQSGRESKKDGNDRQANNSASTCPQPSHVALDAVVACSFMYAAILGGYGSSTAHIRAAMPGWTLGSIVGGVRPMQHLRLMRGQSR